MWKGQQQQYILEQQQQSLQQLWGHAAIPWGNETIVCLGSRGYTYRIWSGTGLAQDRLRAPMIPEIWKFIPGGSSITLTHLSKQHFATASILNQTDPSLVVALKEWCVNSKYCLPSLHADVERYISSCSLYPQPKSPYQLCTGTLGLLPDPGHAWSQIVTDFFFRSWWKYHILVVIASKICCFLPLSDPCFRWWRPCCVRCCRTFVFIAVWNYLDEDHHLESNSQVEKTNSGAWPVSTKPLWGLAG